MLQQSCAGEGGALLAVHHDICQHLPQPTLRVHEKRTYASRDNTTSIETLLSDSKVLTLPGGLKHATPKPEVCGLTMNH
jgi:hypothetical protein